MNKMETIEAMLNSMTEEKTKQRYINPSDLPNIDLYMDQITTFMDTQLENSKRYPDDKILTKTMINNYAKNNLLPPPIKKKYSKDHILLLTFIYYFKNILSMNDIQKMLEPVKSHYFQNPDTLPLEKIYEEIFMSQKANIENIVDDIKEKYAYSSETFADVPENERDTLTAFSFICSLMHDIFLKKQLLERAIDTLYPSEEVKKAKEKTKKDIKK